MALSNAYQNRIFGLDFLRAIAIIIVVVGHGKLISAKLNPDFPFIPLPDGVELFFVLSGFLIGKILIREVHRFRAKAHQFSVLLTFWKRRWFRTLPNYYLALVLNAVVTYFGLNTNDIQYFNWKFFFFLQNFKTPFFGFFWESWSLSIEEWFYIFYPFTLFALAALFKKVEIKKLLIATTLLFILVPLFNKFYLAMTMDVDNFWWDVQFRKTVFTRLDTIVWGVLMAIVQSYYTARINKYKWYLFIAGLVMIIFNLLSQYGANTLYMKSFYFVVNSIGVALLLPVLSSWTVKRNNLFIAGITRISIISYAIYVLHFGLIIQVITKLFVTENAFYNTLLYALYLVLTFGGSTLLYRYFEKPFTDMRPIA
jgi:peptidoglycan/LPS O-acetylase OafA/YrhL